mmetsp:Transcript_27704/g.46572  ORF Transcript_27704/g.46572 Transcript_27704/m.46572 type:complete len:297 (-) Transcript_27704:89-979(-)
MMSTIAELVVATRPWSFTAGIIPVLVTAAVLKVPLLSWNLVSAVAMAVTIQSGANLTNTYYDFQNGVDVKGQSHDRTLVDNKLSPTLLVVTSIACYAVGTSVILPMLLYGTSTQLITVFSIGIVLAYFYTATPVGLKYHALGDVTIFLCFGPLLMQCTSLLLTGQMHSDLYYYTVPIGLLTEAILHANNSRDIENDRKAGATTIAILIGFEASRHMYTGLVIGAYLSTMVIAAKFHWGCLITLLTLPLGIDLLRKFAKNEMAHLEEETAKMHLPFGITLFMGIVLTNSGFLELLGS